MVHRVSISMLVLLCFAALPACQLVDRVRGNPDRELTYEEQRAREQPLGNRVVTWMGFEEAGWRPPNRIEVVRYHVDDAHALEPVLTGQEGFDLDLDNGRAAFFDTNGRAHPMQIEMERVRKLRQSLEGRRWLRDRTPKVNATDMHMYRMKVYFAGELASTEAIWPTRMPNLPAGLSQVMLTFDFAHRRVNPLSNDVNLMTEPEGARR